MPCSSSCPSGSQLPAGCPSNTGFDAGGAAGGGPRSQRCPGNGISPGLKLLFPEILFFKPLLILFLYSQNWSFSIEQNLGFAVPCGSCLWGDTHSRRSRSGTLDPEVEKQRGASWLWDDPAGNARAEPAPHSQTGFKSWDRPGSFPAPPGRGGASAPSLGPSQSRCWLREPPLEQSSRRSCFQLRLRHMKGARG